MEPYVVDPELLEAFIEEALQGLDGALPLVSELGGSEESKARIHDIFHPIHSVKGSAAFFCLMKVKALSHATEDVLDRIRKGALVPDEPLIGLLSGVVLELRSMLHRVKDGKPEVADEASYHALLDQVEKAGQQRVEAALPTEAEGAFLTRLKDRLPQKFHPLVAWVKGVLQGHSPSLPPLMEDTAGRWEADVEAAVLRSGELCRAMGVLAALSEAIPDPQLKEAGEEIARLSHEVNRSLTRLGCTPLKEIGARAGSVAEHVAQETGKSIRVHVEGDEGFLLRSISRYMDEAMTHLVRNAVDHGIETESVRVAEGKSSAGRVVILARRKGERLVVRIEDDGAGINAKRVLEKGRELGLVQENERVLAEDLIFKPGLSTAAEVTELSGRGVGMDIVRRAMEKVGGVVSVDSRKGKGTSVTLEVPLGRNPVKN